MPNSAGRPDKTQAVRVGNSSSATEPSLVTSMLSGEMGTLLALAAVVLFFAIADPLQNGERTSFLTVRNFRVMMTQTSIVAVAALGMTMIIIAGMMALAVLSLAGLYWRDIAGLWLRELVSLKLDLGATGQTVKEGFIDVRELRFPFL